MQKNAFFLGSLLWLLRSLSIVAQNASAPFDLKPVWVRVGDSKGGIDCECDIASVESAEFSPDGKYIISGSKKGWEVVLWDSQTGNKVWEKKLNEETEAVAFARDGRLVAIGGENKNIRMYTIPKGELVHTIQLQASIDGMRFSNKGDLLIGGDEIGRIHVWRTHDWKEIRTAIQGKDEGAEDGAPGVHADVNSVDFTQDDRFVATAGRNSEVKLWRTETMELLRTLKGHTGSVKSTRISPNGKWVASASAWPDTITGDNSVRLWDFQTGQQLVHFRHPKGMEAVEFSPDGRFLLAGGRQGGGYEVANPSAGFIYVYQIPENPAKEPVTLVLKKPVFRCEYLHFSKDGKQLVSAHEDGTLRLWNVIRNSDQKK